MGALIIFSSFNNHYPHGYKEKRQSLDSDRFNPTTPPKPKPPKSKPPKPIHAQVGAFF